MKTRGCTSQRKTTKVRLAPHSLAEALARAPDLPARRAPARRGTVPAELPGAPPPLRSGGTRARTPRGRAENSRPSPSRAGFFGACVSYEIPGEGGKVPQVSVLQPRFFAFAGKAQLPGPPRAGKGAPRSFTPAGWGPWLRSGRGRERARAPRTRPAPRPGRRPESRWLPGAPDGEVCAQGLREPRMQM